MDKKISELDQALQINNDAVFPISQDNGGTDTTYKVSITQISAEVGEDQTFSNLDTEDKTLVGAINEIAQGGGGGGSGHTIVDDDGTSLPQRSKLQFIGAYSKDDQADDTTEVDIVREMTKAAFDQLTADEKVGLINITDESSGQPIHIYSTEEHIVGRWIDGSDIYEKTINVGTITTDTTVAHGITNLDTIIDYSGFGKYAGTDKSVIPFQNPASGYGFGINTYDGTNLVVAKSSSLGSNVSDCYMTLRYTKSV